MQMITTFDEAHAVLAKFSTLQTSPRTLNTIKAFMTHIGSPQHGYRVIHVAGTSGKTSTCSYIAALLSNAGHKVGHTVSPYVDQINERSQINLQVLPETEYCTRLTEFLTLLEASKFQLSYFDILYAFAYWLFAKEHVEYAVIEVGVGGLLDGTNVVEREDKICVITDIGLDHTELLGDTLPAVAAQKAGIIHRGNTVFTHKQAAKIMTVFDKTSKQRGAELNVVPVHLSNAGLNHLPAFQIRNLNLAVASAKEIVSTLNDKDIVDASMAVIPARMEHFEYKGHSVIVDGSHNIQKIEALVSSLHDAHPDTTYVTVFSIGKNKQQDATAMAETLSKISNTAIITSYGSNIAPHARALDTKVLQSHFKNAGFTNISIERDPVKAFDNALSKNDPVLVTGSFYLLDHIRPFLKATI